MACARVMRGISSIAKAVTPDLAMASSARLVAIGIKATYQDGAGLQGFQKLVARDGGWSAPRPRRRNRPG